MIETVQDFRSYLVENFGNCSFCMRQALLAALASWVAWAIVFAFWPGSALSMLVGIAALALTGLWVLHIGVYSLRSAGWAKNRSLIAVDASAHPNRREILTVALRAVAVGMIVSLPAPFAAQAAQCANLCTKNDDCGGSENGWCCKNVAPVNAGYVCNQCRQC